MFDFKTNKYKNHYIMMPKIISTHVLDSDIFPESSQKSFLRASGVNMEYFFLKWTLRYKMCNFIYMALLTFKLKGMEEHSTRSSDVTKTGGFSSIWTTAKHPMVTIDRIDCYQNSWQEQVESTNMLVNGAVYEFCKFFPYDDGKGNPIYDENTGKELRDPVTGEPHN